MITDPRMLTTEQRKKFFELVNDTTLPVQPHEADIITAILGTSHGKDVWRFRKGIKCAGCSRELTVLDYFLASLKHHSAEFIKEEITKDSSGDRIEIVEHELTIPCVVCGTAYESPDYNPYYRHPNGIAGPKVRMSKQAFLELAAQL